MKFFTNNSFKTIGKVILRKKTAADILDDISFDIRSRISERDYTINGEALKELREKSGISRSELAAHTLTTKEIVQGWEEGWGIMNPSSGEISIMAELFHLSEEEFREIINADEENDYDYEE